MRRGVYILIMLTMLTFQIATIMPITTHSSIETTETDSIQKIEPQQRFYTTGTFYSTVIHKNNTNTYLVGTQALLTQGVFIGMYYHITTPDRVVSDPSSGTAVYGKVLILNRYTANASLRHSIPVPGITVSAYDMNSGQPLDAGYIVPPDGSANGANPKGYGYTGTDGFFWFSFSSSGTGTLELNNADIFLNFYLDVPDCCVIVDENGNVYMYRMMDDYSNVPGGAISLYLYQYSTYDPITGEYYYRNYLDTFDTYYALKDNDATSSNYGMVEYLLSGAGGDLVLLSMLARDFYSNVLGVASSKARIVFPYNSTYAPSHYYYRSDTGEIWAAYSNPTNATEFFIAFNQFGLAQFSTLPSFTPEYNLSVHYDEYSAWVNGWSLFLGEVIKEYYNSRGYNFSRIDLDSLYDIDGVPQDEDTIGGVAGLLWDLYDSTSDDMNGDGFVDELSISLSDMWEVVVNRTPTTIYEFLDGLVDLFGVNETLLWRVAWEHGINIDNIAPTTPTVQYVSPIPGTWVNTPTVILRWLASTDNISGLSHYVIHIYNAKTNEIYKDVIVARDNTTWQSELPNGEWNIVIGAVDYADNEATSQTIGPIRIDTIPPTPSGFNPESGVVYFDNLSGGLVLSVNWDDGPSGVETVYIRYKIGDTWSDWIVANYNSTDGYYYIILDSETWKSASGGYIYWESMAVDYAGNTAYSSDYYGVFSIGVLDDDTSKPTVSLGWEEIWDNESRPYVISIQASDPSGIYNITIIVWFGNSSIIYNNQSIIWATGNTFYIEIPTNTWINYVESPVSLEVFVWDNDSDWSGDRTLAYIKAPYGYIHDDDSKGPTVLSVEFWEVGGGDGTIEADEGVGLNITVYDPSGINGTVGILVGGYTVYRQAEFLYYNGTYAILFVENMSLPYGNNDLAVLVFDNDSDRPGDWGVTVYYTGLYIPKEHVDILFSVSNKTVGTYDTITIQFDLVRDDGGLVSLNGTTMYMDVVFEGETIYQTYAIYGETTNISFVPADLNISNGPLYIILFVDPDNPYFESNNATFWVSVWVGSYLELEASYYSGMFGETITFVASLYKVTGEPIIGERIAVFAEINGSLVYLSANTTDSSGRVEIEYIVALAQGNYSIVFVYYGSEIMYIYGSRAYANIIVIRGYGFVSAEEATVVYTDGGHLFVLAKDSFGNPIPNANVSVYLNTSEGIVYLGSGLTNSSGILDFLLGTKFEELVGELGNYTILLVLEDDSRFYGSTNTTTVLYVEDILDGVEVSSNTTTAYWGEDVLIEIFAYDDEGSPITVGTATINITTEDGEQILFVRANLENGRTALVLNTSGIRPVARVIVVVSVESPLYIGRVSSGLRFLVVKTQAYLRVEGAENLSWYVTYGKPSSIKIFIVDAKNNIVEGYGELILSIGDITVYHGPIEPIEVSYPYNTTYLEPGIYYLGVILVSDYFYVPTNTRITLIVESMATETEVNIESLTLGYGDKAEFLARITTELGEPGANMTVSVFLINTTKYLIGSYRTNSTGYARIVFNATYNPGTYIVMVTALETQRYSSSAKNITMVITKEPITLEVEISKSLSVGAPAYIIVRAIDDEGELAYGVPIAIYFGDNLIAKTVVYGEENISWVPPRSGKEKLVVSIISNPFYEGEAISREVDVKANIGGSGWLVFSVLVAILSLIGAGIIFVKKKPAPTGEEGLVGDMEEEFEEAEEIGEETSSGGVEDEFFESFGDL